MPEDASDGHAHILPPHIDIEHVSQYNKHGRSLCSLIQHHAIAQKHHPLLLGLFAVYSLLVSLGHIDPEIISWPPHVDFAGEDWLRIGFAPEVVDLLELLPYLKEGKWGEPIHISHDAPSLSYLGAGNPTYRGPEEIPELLTEKDFFITGNGRGMFGRRHYHYLYRSEDGMFWLHFWAKRQTRC